MSLITRMLKKRAIFWEFIGRDSHGDPTFEAPKRIKCRWDDSNEVFIDAQGEEQVSKAEIYVDRDIPLDSVLLYGEFDDVDDISVPLNNPTAATVRKFDKIDNLKGTESLRIALI